MNLLMLVGIACGLGSATTSALSFLASRWYTASGGKRGGLLAMGHLLLALISLPLAWWAWPADLPFHTITSWGAPLVIECMCFTVGMISVVLLLHMIDASIATPLLGMKLLAAAILVRLLSPHDEYAQLNLLHWVAIGIALVSTLLMRNKGAGKPIPWQAWLCLTLTCLCYATADVHIRKAILQIQHDSQNLASNPSTWRLSVVCAFLANIGMGILSLPLLWRWGTSDLRAWTRTLPYVSALVVMKVLFYTSIAFAGVVLAGILQNGRALIAVALGVVIARLGHHHIESKVTRHVMVARLISAILMLIAVALYVWACR